MLWGLGFVLIIILFILAVIYFYNDSKTENFESVTGEIIKDPFIAINDNNLYMPITDKSNGKPVDIKYQLEQRFIEELT